MKKSLHIACACALVVVAGGVGVSSRDRHAAAADHMVDHRTAPAAAAQEQSAPAADHVHDPHMHDPGKMTPKMTPKPGASDARGDAWICPMHPGVVQDHQGRCPICGMDLVHKGTDTAQPSSSVHVDTAVRQRLGLKIAKAEIKSVAHKTRAYGTAVFDEASLLAITPKVEGWIKSLSVSRVGQRIEAGQVLYEIYSPDLVQRQREYLEVIQRRDRLKEGDIEIAGQTAQVAVSLAREIQRARDKFVRADISPATLDEIERTGQVVEVVPVYAEKRGVVTKLDVRVGSYVNPLASIMNVANDADVRIEAAVHQSDLMHIADGDAVLVTVPNAGQGAIAAKVSRIAPAADEGARVFPVRLSLMGPHPALRPGTAVDVEFFGPAKEVLVVPRSAVMHGGAGARVMVAEGDGHFSPRPIVVGLESNGFAEVKDGLTAGTEVAVSGQFLLDAAASMNDAAQRMGLDP